MKVGDYAMQNCSALESVKFAAATEIGKYAFAGDRALMEADFPVCTKIGNYAFQDCDALSEIDGDELLEIGSDAFKGSSVGKIKAPKVNTFYAGFGEGAWMSTIDLTALSSIVTSQFYMARGLVELILRKTTLITLSKSNALEGTPLAAGIGYVYVPENLVDTYKSASNWSALASQIKPIADYPLAFQNETISDTWAEIFAAEEDGTYSTKYNVGDVKYIDVGGTKLPMQIVAFDTDDLAAGGKAKITWLSLSLPQKQGMNSTGTTAGGWAECALRDWLRERVYPRIESTVRNAIKPVTKTYVTKSPSSGTMSLTDTVWIPSAREMFGGSSYESTGCDYTAFFAVNSALIKTFGQGGATSSWWLRSAYNNTSFFSVASTGNASTNNANQKYGVSLGFCT